MPEESSSGGEDGSRRASGRRRVLFTWIAHVPRRCPAMLHHRCNPSLSPRATLSYEEEEASSAERPCIRVAGLILSRLATVQQVSASTCRISARRFEMETSFHNHAAITKSLDQ